MMIAVYVRVSSRQQDTKSQEPDLKKWADAQDGEVRFYRDKATGKTMDRPAWNKLQSAIEAGEVSQVVCWRLDRLGRTASGLTRLFDDLQKRKVNLVSLKDGLDLGTPAGRLMANVLASVAQFETEVRSERIAAGIEKAKADGKTWGGSKKGRLLSVTPEQIQSVRRMAAEGTKKAAIARATGLSRPTVYRLLGNAIG
ncbi:recombinase family protein [Planctomicrobium sp. SH661]|uniref:recombinase family protein n=1 Tax=Planctomicrobium sp. SH661 TaxID=3448124 RepID=UPI003F5B037A